MRVLPGVVVSIGLLLIFIGLGYRSDPWWLVPTGIGLLGTATNMCLERNP